MTKSEYEAIIKKIYENGRVTDQEGISENTEFHFEARKQDFTDQEIEEALLRFA